jgi:hypothetical protein
MAGQTEKMAAERLSFEQRKIILKWYWKFENLCEVQRQWRREFATESPTRLTVARIRDKHKQTSGRPCMCELYWFVCCLLTDLFLCSAERDMTEG